MSVTLYSQPNCQGEGRSYPAGRYGNLSFRSARITPGWELRVGVHGDGPINLRMGPYDSSSSDVRPMLWGHLPDKGFFGRVDVVHVGNAPTGLLRGRNGTTHWLMPYGDTHGGSAWYNDAAEDIIVPAGCTAQVWDNDDKTGDSMLFHGTDGSPQSLDRMRNRVSYVRLSADAVEAVGAPVLDWKGAVDLGTTESVGAHAVLDNSANPTEATLSTEIGVDASSTAQTHWDLSAGGSITSSTTIGTGEASPVKVEEQVSIEVRFDASKGGSHSTTASKHVSQTVEALCPPHERRRVEMIVTQKRQHVPMRQRVRNSVTGREFWISGMVTLDMVTDTTARVVA